MKKTILTLFAGFALFNYANAQVSAYSFTQTSGTYTAITGGTVLGDTTSDDQRFVDPATPMGGTTTTGVGFPIGFNFTFNGVVFDRFAVNNNGWISLGQSSLTPSVDNASSSGYTAISATSTATNTALRNRIAGLSKDLDGQTGSELRTQTIGTAPNRVCVVQWKKYRKYSFSNNQGDDFNFQIRLNETTNTAEVVYGTMVNNTTLAQIQVGLGGTTAADFNNRKTSTNWAATTAGAANTDTCRLSSTIKPTSGQTYTWTPPPACTGTPTPGTATGPATVCANDDFELALTGFTPNVSGLTFQWQSSTTSGGTYTNIVGATNATYSASQTATTYYKCVVTCGGSANASSNVVTVGMTAANLCYCFITSGCGAGDEIINVTVSTLNNTSICTTGGFSRNYSLAVPNLMKTSVYPMSVTVGDGGTEHVSVWIDYNQNGTFEPTEFTSIGSGNDTTVIGNITIPTTATVGNTGMRVRSKYNTALTDTAACFSYTYGETEDYVVNITAFVGVEENEAMLNSISVSPNPTTGLFNIATSNANFSQMNISVIDIQGKVVFSASDKNNSSNYNKQINLEGLAKGLYYIKLNADNGVRVQKLIVQ